MSSQRSLDNTPNESPTPTTRESGPVPDQGPSPAPARDAERGLADPPDGVRDRAPEVADVQPAASRTRPPSLWRNWDYMCWWSGNAVSLLGSNLSNMAFPLLAVFSTGSVLNAGIIAAAGRIGGLLTLLWAERSRIVAQAR
jgi:hypothetical protein